MLFSGNALEQGKHNPFDINLAPLWLVQVHRDPEFPYLMTHNPGIWQLGVVERNIYSASPWPMLNVWWKSLKAPSLQWEVFLNNQKNPGNLATGLWTMMGFRNMIFLSNYGDFVDIHVRCGSFPGCQAVVSGGGLLQDLRFFPTKNHVSLLVMSLGGNMHLKKFSHVSDNLVTDHPPLRNGFKKWDLGKVTPWHLDLRLFVGLKSSKRYSPHGDLNMIWTEIIIQIHQ